MKVDLIDKLLVEKLSRVPNLHRLNPEAFAYLINTLGKLATDGLTSEQIKEIYPNIDLENIDAQIS